MCCGNEIPSTLRNVHTQFATCVQQCVGGLGELASWLARYQDRVLANAVLWTGAVGTGFGPGGLQDKRGSNSCWNGH